MANRNTFNGSSTDVPWPNVGMPEGFGDQYARHIKTLYDVAAFPLTDIGGTADDVTATLDPALDSGGLVDGMKFTLTWDADNTGPMTLALNGGAAVDVLQADGSAMIADAAKAGTRVLVEYIGGDFRLIGGGAGAGSVDPYYTAITASGTWNKPAGFPDDAIVEIEGWGGGGGGGRTDSASGGGPGGGAGYKKYRGLYKDIPSSLSIVIGAGGNGALSGVGQNGTVGGNTTVGSLLTAYGGGPGSGTDAGQGGTEFAAGGASSTQGADAASHWSGGGGGQNGGGKAVYGGGGGGGNGTPTPGISLFGGTGGTGSSGGSSAAGSGNAPGGGGGGARTGNAGNGARGEVRIWIFG